MSKNLDALVVGDVFNPDEYGSEWDHSSGETTSLVDLRSDGYSLSVGLTLPTDVGFAVCFSNSYDGQQNLNTLMALKKLADGYWEVIEKEYET